MTLRAVVALAMGLTACGGASVEGCDTLGELDGCQTAEETPGLCREQVCVAVPPCAGDTCASNVTFSLGDTRVSACVGDSSAGDGTIECPGVGGESACADTPYCGQDGQYASDGLSGEARMQVETVGAEAVAIDAVTGLTWQRCAAGQAEGTGCGRPATRGSWHEAVAYCQQSEWAGFDDWVLPEAAALHSIVDFGATSPAISSTVLSSPPSLFDTNSDEWWIECMWSATEDATDANVAWALMVNSGDISRGSGLEYHPNDKGAATWPGCYTTCVRAPRRPTQQRFIPVELEGVGLVVDTVGDRIWQACSVGQAGDDCAGVATPMTWVDALSACEASTAGGFDDWRLPDIVELYSIADPRTSRPAVDEALFANTPFYTGVDNLEGQFWSSTGRSYNRFALYVSFNDANTHFYVQDEARHVRCVRN